MGILQVLTFIVVFGVITYCTKKMRRKCLSPEYRGTKLVEKTVKITSLFFSIFSLVISIIMVFIAFLALTKLGDGKIFFDVLAIIICLATAGIFYFYYKQLKVPKKSNSGENSVEKSQKRKINEYSKSEIIRLLFGGLCLLISIVAGLSAFAGLVTIFIERSRHTSTHDIPLTAMLLFISVAFYFCYKTLKKIKPLNFEENSIMYKFLVFKGTFNRGDYFIGDLILYSLILGLLAGISFGITALENLGSGAAYFVVILFLFILIVPVICLMYSMIVITVKRIVDMGRSPWLLLLFLVPGVNVLFQICLYFFPSKTQRDEKECPECAEMVLAKAQKCRFCGHIFSAEEAK